MNAFVGKDMKRNLAMKLLTDKMIASILTNVPLEQTIVTCSHIVPMRNLCGHVSAMMDITVTVITARKSIIVSRIHVRSIRSASVKESTDPFNRPTSDVQIS